MLSSVATYGDANAITMGYGVVKTSVFPDNLQFAKFKTINSEECPYAKSVAKGSLVCAKALLSSLCFGDMGDPLVSALSGRLLGVAISTWGDCDVNRPQTYTDVTPYMDWIVKTINEFAFAQYTPNVRV